MDSDNREETWQGIGELAPSLFMYFLTHFHTSRFEMATGNLISISAPFASSRGIHILTLCDGNIFIQLKRNTVFS